MPFVKMSAVELKPLESRSDSVYLSQRSLKIFDVQGHIHLPIEEIAEAWYEFSAQRFEHSLRWNECSEITKSRWMRSATFMKRQERLDGAPADMIAQTQLRATDSEHLSHARHQEILKSLTDIINEKKKATIMKFIQSQFVTTRSCSLTIGENNVENIQKEKLRS